MSTPDNGWPGQQFGLPQEGSRSTPTYLRRVVGLAVDWALAWVISAVFFGADGFATLLVFIGANALGGLLIAGSPGHLVARIRIAPIKGGALGLIAPLVRPLLIALVIPAILVDSDMRGLHDRLVGTILVVR